MAGKNCSTGATAAHTSRCGRGTGVAIVLVERPSLSWPGIDQDKTPWNAVWGEFKQSGNQYGSLSLPRLGTLMPLRLHLPKSPFWACLLCLPYGPSPVDEVVHMPVVTTVLASYEPVATDRQKSFRLETRFNQPPPYMAPPGLLLASYEPVATDRQKSFRLETRFN